MDLDCKGMCSEFEPVCIKCDPNKKIEQGLRAKGKSDGYYCQVIGRDCPFRITSNTPTNKCVAPSARVFKKYGLKPLNEKSTYLYGKSHFLFYLYHPEMNWQPPEIPERNRFGQLVEPGDIYTLAHIDGDHFNDSKENLIWLLKSEHGILEPNTLRKEPETLKEAGLY